MSICTIILELEDQGELVRYVPTRTTRRPRRRLFMNRRMAGKFDDRNSAVNLLVGRGPIEAALMVWALGDWLYDDGEGGPGFIKRLEPPPSDVWEIRVTNPAPQVRIFGRFAEPDTYIATDMNTRNFLGRKGSQAWKQACAQCAADWSALFPINAPHSGVTVGDYITENYDDFPLA